jgi:hypothetical protein
MNLDEVIAQFETEHKGKFSKSDREAIVTALKSLDVKDFFISYRKDVKTKEGKNYSTYFQDELDVVHVHPTMIVARTEFKGADSTGRSKYRMYPYITQLSGWATKADATRPICPNCFLTIPLIGVCGTCEFDINDVGDE